MKKNYLSRLARSESKSLQNKHFENYLLMFEVLYKTNALEHPDFHIITKMFRSLQNRNFLDALEHADTLALQKYASAHHTFVAAQFSNIVRKYPFPTDQFDPRGKAIEKFAAAELLAQRTNKLFRLRALPRGRAIPLRYNEILERARSFVHYVLGDSPDEELVFRHIGFGPGASIGVTGQATNVKRKLNAKSWSVSPGAFNIAYTAVASHAQLREFLIPQHGGFGDGGSGELKSAYLKKIGCVKYNNITFVPKTTRVHRTIAVEPLLNGLIQKGIDVYMRLLLKRIGIDLSDQSRNARMACEGSFDREDGFATIDLSSASDSISIEFCRYLLPPDWFALLKAVRSPNYKLDGVEKTYAKFCSMGNGFCFPLETLLFAALCHGVGAGRPNVDFRVYGDDIIVRKPFTANLICILRYCGFRTNKEKTFLDGPFRESCGSDWFEGLDVRPYTLDFALDSVQNLFKILNLTIETPRKCDFWLCVRPFLLSLIHPKLQFFRPYPGPVDSAITSLGDEYLTCPTVRWRKPTYSWKWIELISTAVEDPLRIDDLPRAAITLLYGALSGSASTLPFAWRRKTRTKVRLISHSGATSQWLPPGAQIMVQPVCD